MNSLKLSWTNSMEIPSRSYTCGYCEAFIASNRGYKGTAESTTGKPVFYIYICHHCDEPTYIAYGGVHIPGASFGNSVQDIPSDEVRGLYEEARKCIRVNSFTGSVLCSRKLLMNIAVSKGADKNLRFAQYVDYLASKGYVPPDGKEWVDHIRKKGNEATHEIAIMTRQDAEDLVTFAEALLRFIYEYPAIMLKRKSPKP